MRAELMDCDVNYIDNLERKNTHLNFLPQEVEMMSTKSVELLAELEMTKASRKARNGNPTAVPATKQVISKK